MTLLAELAETYLTACEVEGKANTTIRGYRESLSRVQEVGAELGFPSELEGYTVQHVYQFLGVLRERGASRAYQHRLHREVKAFFSWCKRHDLVTENVFARVPLVKLEQQIVQPFSPDDIRRLLGAIDRTTKMGRRDYALVLFLLDTGVRASECVSVQLDDVDWERGRVRVLHGKGQKQRWVGLGEQAREALREYLPVRGDGPGPLFFSMRLKRGMHSHALNVLFSRLGVRAGVAHVYPHRFRHTFATWAIRSQAREIDVQSLLGHSSLTMVQRYARTYSSEQAVLAHESFSPVAHLALD